MFAVNAATTRLVLDHFRSYPDVDCYALADAFVDPNRSEGRRTLVDLLGKTRHRRWARWAWGEIVFGIGPDVTDRGPESVLVSLSAIHGSDVDWWGSPHWPDRVEAFIRQLGEQPPGMTIRTTDPGELQS